jgi:hypothetical protein
MEGMTMSMTQTENRTHNATCNLSEAVRQSAIAAAGTGPSGAAAVRTAEITHLRNCRASAIANGCSPAAFIAALTELGTGGV